MSIEKLKRAIKLDKAIRDKKEAFVLMERLDELDEKISGIKPADLTALENEIRQLKEKKEDIEVELEII